MEKTQAYNLSLGASAHDCMAAVTSTRRASVVDIRPGKDQGFKPRVFIADKHNANFEELVAREPLVTFWAPAVKHSPHLLCGTIST